MTSQRVLPQRVGLLPEANVGSPDPPLDSLPGPKNLVATSAGS